MMQQVAAQNTDIAAFGTTKVPAIKVNDNASEAFNKVFNEENRSYAKPVPLITKTEGESQKITSTDKTDKVGQGDSPVNIKEGKNADPVKETAEKEQSKPQSRSAGQASEETSERSESQEESFTSIKENLALQSAESAKLTAVSDVSDEKSILVSEDSAAADEKSALLSADLATKVKEISQNEESALQDKASDLASILSQLSDSAENESELLFPEQESHTQLMDFISKLQSQPWGQTQTEELGETLALFEAIEQKPQVISQSLLNTLMAKLTPSAAEGEDELTNTPEKLDDTLLTQLLAILGEEQSAQSAVESSTEVDGVLIDVEQVVSKADLALLSVLLLPASSESVDSELSLKEGGISEQLQLDMLADGSDNKGSDSQVDVELVGLATKPAEVSAEQVLPESLQDIPIKAQVEQDVVAPVNKLIDDQALKSLLKVPENKLEQVLTNLAQRMFEQQSPAEQATSISTASTEQDKQLLVADFVSALKAGVDEFKQQLKQGREPGIDLKALVAEALGKVSEVSADSVKDPLKLEQAAKSFSQVLELGQNIHSALEQHVSATNVYDRQVRGESNQLHIETAKSQLTQQTQNSQFDKAVNINKPEGHQQLAEKVQWMVNQKNMLAEIRLDPAELGSMSVKVNIQGDAASVSFVVQNQHAREALEQAVPRLREMLAEKGIALGQSSVQQDNKNKQDGDGSQSKGQFASQEEELQLDEQTAVISQRITNGALGGIDYFV